MTLIPRTGSTYRRERVKYLSPFGCRVTIRTEDCDCKVGRVVDQYDLDGMHETLAARRTGEDGSPASLRTLTDEFNQAVLRAAMRPHGAGVLDGEVENGYRLLTAEDVSRGMRTRARKQLENDGVDVDAVEASFVSHPTMGRHLETCLDVEPEPKERDPTEVAKERVFKLLSRAEAVVGNAVEGLASADRIAAGEIAVTVDVRVTCQRCGVQATAASFIDRGGCDCGYDNAP